VSEPESSDKADEIANTLEHKGNCMEPVKVGLLGLGTVGGGTVTVLSRNAVEIARRAGRGIEISHAAARAYDPERIQGLETIGRIGDDAFAVVDDPEVQIVVELIGGYSPARELVLKAIENGKHVVTANKALIAVHGNEIFAKAAREGRHRRLRSRRRRWHPGDQGDA
jgi:homoserine dehydrogenase